MVEIGGLLIEPQGIEMAEMDSKVDDSQLLIEPQGIEISVRLVPVK